MAIMGTMSSKHICSGAALCQPPRGIPGEFRADRTLYQRVVVDAEKAALHRPLEKGKSALPERGGDDVEQSEPNQAERGEAHDRKPFLVDAIGKITAKQPHQRPCSEHARSGTRLFDRKTEFCAEERRIETEIAKSCKAA